MLHTVLTLFGVVAGLVGITLAFLSQRYWFARGWSFAARLRSRSWRLAFETVLILAVGTVAGIALLAVTKNSRGTISRGSPWNAFFGLWLSSSIVSYLFIKAIAGIERLAGRFRTAEGAAAPLPSDDQNQGAILRPAAAAESVDPSRRYFFQAAGVIAGAIPFASATYGFIAERFRYTVREIDIPVANLPAALDGFHITQLSDIHIGSYMPLGEVRRAVDMANELRGDVAFVTGDFITGRLDPLEDCIAELAHLRAPLGVWGCNGNHEIYARVEARSATLFHRYGMKLLRHENAELKWNGSALNLIGVDYQRDRDHRGNHPPMLVGLEPLLRRDVPNVLLSHNPNTFRRAAELGIELSIAGHTHGGQVRVEILDHDFSPAEFFTPYVAGLYTRPLFSSSKLSDAEISAASPASRQQPPISRIYVNRGLGTIGAPVRLGVPPEITLITLRCA